MIEVRFHGRGGQGTVVASIILAKALFRSGFYVQSFPLFGVERRGAPVEAFLRWDSRKILKRTNVYRPDHVVVMDSTLLQRPDTLKVITSGIKPGGFIIMNTALVPPLLEPLSENLRLAWVDATAIARKHRLGTHTHPIVNTAVIGAFARVLGVPDIASLEEAIREEIPIKTEANVQAAREAYEAVVIGDEKERGVMVS
ncbi:2-oxoacid:acceptor oxidoreductase family protein [Thermodesulforhabdus norvegica]|uniref:Pyruvate ferredoxin oxidoreductase gamma subunit n=1 Tax=Thermodesulforhabdus norvegica TaxID=39841 RepID=A0A1I4VR46_9BACT|nr:2-oxoacid:acceptor oxidoreductase family protein [Thermodesulforhabdus norvegica]SFN03585.1 pyruvate ferredoxin oxidoreductase gamma subunit [Thermodesulforhabdus norvegica]